MDYILVEIDGIGQAYQEISNGQVTRYLDSAGAYLFDVVPTGHGSKVIDAAPARQPWMI